MQHSVAYWHRELRELVILESSDTTPLPFSLTPGVKFTLCGDAGELT